MDKGIGNAGVIGPGDSWFEKNANLANELVFPLETICLNLYMKMSNWGQVIYMSIVRLTLNRRSEARLRFAKFMARPA